MLADEPAGKVHFSRSFSRSLVHLAVMHGRCTVTHALPPVLVGMITFSANNNNSSNLSVANLVGRLPLPLMPLVLATLHRP